MATRILTALVSALGLQLAPATQGPEVAEATHWQNATWAEASAPRGPAEVSVPMKKKQLDINTIDLSNQASARHARRGEGDQARPRRDLYHVHGGEQQDDVRLDAAFMEADMEAAFTEDYDKNKDNDSDVDGDDDNDNDNDNGEAHHRSRWQRHRDRHRHHQRRLAHGHSHGRTHHPGEEGARGDAQARAKRFGLLDKRRRVHEVHRRSLRHHHHFHGRHHQTHHQRRLAHGKGRSHGHAVARVHHRSHRGRGHSHHPREDALGEEEDAVHPREEDARGDAEVPTERLGLLSKRRRVHGGRGPADIYHLHDGEAQEEARRAPAITWEGTLAEAHLEAQAQLLETQAKRSLKEARAKFAEASRDKAEGVGPRQVQARAQRLELQALKSLKEARAKLAADLRARAEGAEPRQAKAQLLELQSLNEAWATEAQEQLLQLRAQHSLKDARAVLELHAQQSLKEARAKLTEDLRAKFGGAALQQAQAQLLESHAPKEAPAKPAEGARARVGGAPPQQAQAQLLELHALKKAPEKLAEDARARVGGVAPQQAMSDPMQADGDLL